MEIKFCDRCGKETHDLEETVIDFTKFNYCKVDLEKLRIECLELRKNAIKIMAEKLGQ